MASNHADLAPPLAAAGRRAEVLERLREAAGPLSAGQLAELVGLHVNTARFHLDALVEVELVERSAEPRSAPGRPRVLYTVAGRATGARSYALLAEMLTGLVLTLPDAEPAARQAGRTWGRHLVQRPSPSEQVEESEAVSRLADVLASVGFEPDVGPPDDVGAREIRLHNCPFREVAERHADVVCGLHLGLMQGALSELRAPIEAITLQPLVRPSLCLAGLSRTERSAS